MTTSGTYNFAPGAGDIALIAIGRCGKRRTQALTEMLIDAQFEANLLLSDWSTRPGPNYWATDTVTVPLIKGTATYTLAATIIMPLNVWLTVGSGSAAFDRPLGILSTVDYTSLSSKTLQSQPTSYFFDRQITPTITTWPVADQTSQYTLNVRRWRQPQDTVLAGGVQPEVPFRFLDAFCWDLAARLSWEYAPERTDKLELRAQRAWSQASSNDAEMAPISIIPGLAGYNR